MGYVMVPVPEEHADELTQFVLGLTVRAKMVEWPPGALEEHIAGLADQERQFVAAVNQFALDSRVSRQPDITDTTGIDAETLNGLVQQMAERCWAAKLSPLILAGVEDVRDPDGTVIQVTTYTISHTLSPRVRAALATP